jgi:hypothetical protein
MQASLFALPFVTPSGFESSANSDLGRRGGRPIKQGRRSILSLTFFFQALFI